jgi:hypothetical protein
MSTCDRAGQRKVLRRVILLLLTLLAGDAFGQAPAAQEFEVASIRRNVSDSRPWLAPPVAGRFTATNISLKLFLGVGWPQKVTGGPAWVYTDGYDISAIMPRPDESAMASRR